MPTILHIEDDPSNRLLVSKLLTKAGYHVTDAVDGLDGIRKARAERPDLILVDIAIPGLDGYEVTLRLRAEPSLNDVPIVAITAEGSREASLAVGCDGFMQKPIRARSFVETVRGYLKGRRDLPPPDPTGEALRRQSQLIASHLEEKVAQLSAANARLVELDHARKAFYRNISHELSTPMTPIVGYVRLLRDSELGPLTDSQAKSLAAVDDCVRRLRTLIDSLLDVTGIETGRLRLSMRDYDLGRVVREEISHFATSIQARSQRLAVDVPAAGLKGWGDPDCLGRAVAQLLDNAIKFTPEGETIGVKLSETDPGWYEVCIADNGPGVPEARRKSIFDAFFQVDGSPTREHGGTGVGLAIAQGIAQGHGGSVSLDSPAREQIQSAVLTGAAFKLRVPVRAVRLMNAPQAED